MSSIKNAIILHGRPDKEEYYDPIEPSQSNANWLPWLQGRLIKNDIHTATPEVPRCFETDWSIWNREVERFDITPTTILVGHSTGAGFFIKYISIHPEIKVGKVILVAPWIDPEHTRTVDFFDDFEIDPNLAKRTAGITIFNSSNDMDTIQKTVEILRDKIKNVNYKEFQNYGHFTYKDMNTTEFPELLKEAMT